MVRKFEAICQEALRKEAIRQEAIGGTFLIVRHIERNIFYRKISIIQS